MQFDFFYVFLSNFIDNFSNLYLTLYELTMKIDLPVFDKFLTTESGINYIGKILKDMDIKFYLYYAMMINMY